MTKVSLELDQALNQRLKQYCASAYPDSYGHQQEVIRQALAEYLDRHSKRDAFAVGTKQAQAAPKRHDSSRAGGVKAATDVTILADAVFNELNEGREPTAGDIAKIVDPTGKLTASHVSRALGKIGIKTVKDYINGREGHYYKQDVLPMVNKVLTA